MVFFMQYIWFILLIIASCSSTTNNPINAFNPENNMKNTGYFAGQIIIKANGVDVTDKVNLCFITSNVDDKLCVNLQKNGAFLLKGGIGNAWLGMIECEAEEKYRSAIANGFFKIGQGNSVSYLGKVVINWTIKGNVNEKSLLEMALSNPIMPLPVYSKKRTIGAFQLEKITYPLKSFIKILKNNKINISEQNFINTSMKFKGQ